MVIATLLILSLAFFVAERKMRLAGHAKGGAYTALCWVGILSFFFLIGAIASLLDGAMGYHGFGLD